MPFRPMRAYTYLNYHVNLAVSSIQHDRFIRERAADGLNSPAAQVESSPKIIRGRLKTCIDNLLWMLECNQLCMLDMLMCGAVNSILITNSTMAMCYIWRPRERNPATGEHLDPLLRFFDTIHWFDTARRFDTTGKFHQLLLIMCAPFLCRRVESLLSLYKNAQLNRHRYKKLDITPINIAPVDQLTVKSVRDFVRFLFECRRHKCDRKYVLRTAKGAELKRETYALMASADKLDWLYYHNLISFDDCFAQASKYLVMPARDSLAPVEQEPGSLTSRFLTLCGGQGRGRHFIASPYHRFDPQAVFYPMLLYLVSVIGAPFVILFGVFIYYYPVLCANGLESDDVLRLLISLWPAFTRSLMDSSNLLELVEIVMYILSIAVHITDSGFLIHDANIEYSRAKSVIDMLEVEVHHHDLQVYAFYRSLSRSERFAQTRDHLEVPLRLGPSGNRTVLYREGYREAKRPAGTWEAFAIDKAKVLEFNENIRYLLNLIKILQCEQRDLKAQFTWKLNLSVFAGICGLSIAWSLLMACKTVHQFFVILIPTLIIIMPITFSLFMGATSEGAFRKITRTIRPLMVNELQLIDRDVIRDLQKEYAHMSVIGNRSFMILGSIPLTFGSLTSIVGWTATFNLLFQQYLS